MDAALDSLHIYKRLKAARLGDKPAREIATILHEVANEQLVTKKDILQLRMELEAKIELSVEKGKVTIIAWVAGMMFAQLGFIAALFKLIK